MNKLKDLEWEDSESYSEVKHELFYYGVIPDPESDGKFAVRYKYSSRQPATGFLTKDEAKEWCWNNYNLNMKPYLT